jgi:hypothetical protein
MIATMASFKYLKDIFKHFIIFFIFLNIGATLLDSHSYTILMMVFCRAHIVVHTIFCLGFCLEGVGLMWTWSLILHWSRIDEFVFGLKSVDEL